MGAHGAGRKTGTHTHQLLDVQLHFVYLPVEVALQSLLESDHQGLRQQKTTVDSHSQCPKQCSAWRGGGGWRSSGWLALALSLSVGMGVDGWRLYRQTEMISQPRLLLWKPQILGISWPVSDTAMIWLKYW